MQKELLSCFLPSTYRLGTLDRQRPGINDACQETTFNRDVYLDRGPETDIHTNTRTHNTDKCRYTSTYMRMDRTGRAREREREGERAREREREGER